MAGFVPQSFDGMDAALASNEISRDAVVIYLNNMRMIETVIYESERKKDQLERDLRRRAEQVSMLQQEVSRGIYKESLLDGTLEYIIDGLGWLVLLAGIVVPVIGAVVVIILLAIVAARKEKKEYRKRKQIWQEKEKSLSRELDEYNRRKENYPSIIAGLDGDIRRYEKLRQDGYAVNLIPYSSNPSTNCRCLHGVLSLYEFMSTSRESLTTALGHYKLDQIISRLDELIARVNEVISNQMDIMQQQGEILEQLQRNEKKMDKLNDYAKIAAHNSALQTDMARESLYYQRVDYFSSPRSL